MNFIISLCCIFLFKDFEENINGIVDEEVHDVVRELVLDRGFVLGVVGPSAFLGMKFANQDLVDSVASFLRPPAKK